jgi:FkbM family methyltransferase
MLISYAEVVRNFFIGNPEKVVHVGAHWGTEVPDYLDNGVTELNLFEPLRYNLQCLYNQFGVDPRVRIHGVALGRMAVPEIPMHVASNQGQSSSILEPLLHLEQYPSIKFPETEMVEQRTLDSYGLENVEFLNMDVQGYELEVLHGAYNTLETVQVVYTEVNRLELYRNGCMVEDLDRFLAEYGMRREATDWLGGSWGDAVYVKK